MVNIRAAIYAKLTEIIGANAGVYHFYPDTDASYPAVSYYESGNRQYEQADGNEYLTEINYQMDVWARKMTECDTIAQYIDTAMTSLGFRRETCMDVNDPNCRHRTMRYRALLTQDGTVYQ